MNRTKSILLFLIAFVLFFWADRVRAQDRRFGLDYLARPTLSPWLDLFRRDTGPLPNYHQFVRPKQQLRQALLQQGTAIQRQGAEIQALEMQPYQGQRPGSLRPTGTASVFMNYSHYYPGLRVVGRR